MIKKCFGALLVSALVFLSIWFYQQHQIIDTDKIVQNSELGKKGFSLPVKEVISPKHKIKAYLLEDKTNPIISINFSFAHAGIVAEDQDKSGIACLTSSIQSAAAGDLKYQDFQKTLDDYAITLGFSADKDNYNGNLHTTKEYAPTAFKLLKLGLNSPRFDREDIIRNKKAMRYLLKTQQENPESRLNFKAGKIVYQNHPYGRNKYGTEASIKTISKQDMLNFIHKNLGLDNLSIGISGDMTEQEVATMLDDVFGALPPKGAVDNTEEIHSDFSQDDINIDADIPQNISMMLSHGIKRLDKDFYPLHMADYILGGSGLNSRINLQAREKEGLTYGVYSGLVNYDKHDLIFGGFSATQQNFPRVVEIVKQEWNKMGQFGVTQQELDKAKNAMLASNNLRFADITVISAMLLYMQQKGLGIDFLQKRNQYVEEISLEDVNRVARTYFTPDNLRFISIGKFSNQQEK